MLKPGHYTFRGVHHVVTLPGMHLDMERIDGAQFDVQIEDGLYVAVDAQGNVLSAYAFSGQWLRAK